METPTVLDATPPTHIPAFDPLGWMTLDGYLAWLTLSAQAPTLTLTPTKVP